MINLDKIKKNKFFKSVILIAGGTATAQLMNALSSPIITRIYTPEEYGILTIFLTVVGILSLGALKYEMAIPIAESNKKAIDSVITSFLVLFSYFALVFITVFLLNNKIIKLLNIEDLGPYIFFVPITILLIGAYQIFRQWALRTGNAKAIGKTTISQSFAGNITKIFLGLLHFGPIGLILGSIIKESSGIYVLSKDLRLEFRKSNVHFKVADLKIVLHRYRNFPFYNLPSHILNNISTKLPHLFLGIIYGTTVIGLFGLASTIVRIPARLIGMSVGDVFYSEAAKYGNTNPEKLSKLSNQVVSRLLLIGVIPTIILLIFGPKLFSIAFGTAWTEAGRYASIISIMIFANLVFTPSSRIYEVFEKQKLKLVIDISKTLIILFLFSIAYYYNWSIYSTLFAYTIVFSAYHFIVFLIAKMVLLSIIKERKKL